MTLHDLPRPSTPFHDLAQVREARAGREAAEAEVDSLRSELQSVTEDGATVEGGAAGGAAARLDVAAAAATETEARLRAEMGLAIEAARAEIMAEVDQQAALLSKARADCTPHASPARGPTEDLPRPSVALHDLL